MWDGVFSCSWLRPGTTAPSRPTVTATGTWTSWSLWSLVFHQRFWNTLVLEWQSSDAASARMVDCICWLLRGNGPKIKRKGRVKLLGLGIVWSSFTSAESLAATKSWTHTRSRSQARSSKLDVSVGSGCNEVWVNNTHFSWTRKEIDRFAGKGPVVGVRRVRHRRGSNSVRLQRLEWTSDNRIDLADGPSILMIQRLHFSLSLSLSLSLS